MNDTIKTIYVLKVYDHYAKLKIGLNEMLTDYPDAEINMANACITITEPDRIRKIYHRVADNLERVKMEFSGSQYRYVMFDRHSTFRGDIINYLLLRARG